MAYEFTSCLGLTSRWEMYVKAYAVEIGVVVDNGRDGPDGRLKVPETISCDCVNEVRQEVRLPTDCKGVQDSVWLGIIGTQFPCRHPHLSLGSGCGRITSFKGLALAGLSVYGQTSLFNVVLAIMVESAMIFTTE